MSLEELLAPVKWVDEQVLRQYTKLTKKWEDKGRSRYSLARIFNVSSIVTGIYSLHLGYGQSYIKQIVLGYLHGTDFIRNFLEPKFKKDISDGTTVELLDPLYTKKIANVVRLPSLAYGATFMGRGIIDLVDYIRTANTESLSNAVFNLSFGYGFLGTASSMYVKDSDPKLLDKQSLTDKISELSLQPIPVKRLTKTLTATASAFSIWISNLKSSAL